jgi:solute carrier family 25 phosphate transporter 3
MRLIIREEGPAAMFKGWAPTLVGYSLQGMFKFGLYEYFKDLAAHLLGPAAAARHRSVVWLLGSAAAEFLADVALCPMEMVKVRVQTAEPGSWPTGLAAATRLMLARRAETGFPLGAVVPLWSRQVPYTMAKFFFFEQAVRLAYARLLTKPKASYSRPAQLGVTFAAGYAAGVLCAVVSHPADNLLSLMARPAHRGKRLAALAAELGLARLCTRGLGVRVLMVGTLTGLQWWLYDAFKAAVGMPTSGGR